jgi:hypothetical protein
VIALVKQPGFECRSVTCTRLPSPLAPSATFRSDCDSAMSGSVYPSTSKNRRRLLILVDNDADEENRQAVFDQKLKRGPRAAVKVASDENQPR